MHGLDGISLANPDYVEAQYRRWVDDPDGVEPAWRLFFAGFELGSNGNGVAPELRQVLAAAPAPDPVAGVPKLVHLYRELGHLCAHLNPLEPPPPLHPLLRPSEVGIAEGDLDRVVEPGDFRGIGRTTIRELIDRLRATYCGTIGVEFLHIPEKERREWLLERMEPSGNQAAFDGESRGRVLDDLIAGESFEQFLGTRYPGAKRFSLEGAEALIPMLTTLVDEAGDLGVAEIVFGMPHRGRLNVLANVLRKPYEIIISEFEGAQLAREATGDGDVKYHLGYSRDHTTRTGRRVHVSLAANPSHLEAINPVVEGMVRAKQDRREDWNRQQVIPVLMHGDAAFTGQGVVFETLWLSELSGYHTGGTIHLIVNNQIGFTTSPKAFRFTPHPTDLAKVIQAPVFHVNGDDPEAAVQAARLAIAFRQRFREDVIIDLVCYRRQGHNELDDPTYTQPTMYATIAKHPTTLTRYCERLVAEGAFPRDEIDRRATDFRETLDAAQQYARDFMPRRPIFVFGGAWEGLGWAGEDWSAQTALPAETLREIARGFARVPEGFTIHPRLERQLAQRVDMVERGAGIDWGCGEALAIGSLVLEGYPVRLSGQDAGRGTFSHRHAVLHDHVTGAAWVPLNHLRADQGQGFFVVKDSMLSEYAVLGFEFGLSLADPHRLVLWEAQFGDFANGAQIIIDQFLMSSESKWQRMSGLVLLLPHGYEGQGPEHSSARLERFLQLCAEDNVQVCNLTTPAQYFHALRRQMHRTFRKPLVIMSPKSLLRHKLAVSALTDFTEGTFEPVIDDLAAAGAPDTEGAIDRAGVRRVVFCSGKIYYALLNGRRERSASHTAIVRVEQLHPFPARELTAIVAAYPHATQWAWVQEEPRNMGAWSFVCERAEWFLPRGASLAYVGRSAAASPATGDYKAHQVEEADIVQRALGR